MALKKTEKTRNITFAESLWKTLDLIAQANNTSMQKIIACMVRVGNEHYKSGRHYITYGLKPGEKKIRRNVHFDEQYDECLQRLAEESGRTVNRHIAFLVEVALFSTEYGKKMLGTIDNFIRR